MSPALNPAAPHHPPIFITPPGGTDVLMAVVAVFLVLAVLGIGILFLRLHTLPERIAHRSQKLQFEIVAILGLLALFTHMHIFWVAGLLLAFVDFPDFSTPLRRLTRAVERIAGVDADEPLPEERLVAAGHHGVAEPTSPARPSERPVVAAIEEPSHA